MKKKTKRLTLAEKNAAFNKLSKPEKRVQIAKDVLNQLRLNKLKAVSQIYVDSKLLYSLEDTRENLSEDIKNKDLKDLLDEEGSCTACGIGSLFVCAVKRMDKLKISELISPSGKFYGIEKFHIANYLKKYFSHFELAKIESVFELAFFDRSCGNKPFNDSQLVGIEKAAFYFNTDSGLKLSAKQRMEIIMKNIIDNGGTFKIPDVRYGLKPSTLKK